MPHPKRRHSRSRRNMRRAHDGLAPPGMSVCPDCQDLVRPHVVCPLCGYYKGRKVIQVKGAS